jgi:hypothetical protein
MRMSASWFGSLTHRIQGRGAIGPRPKGGLPSDRHPDRTKRAVVLEAVKVWPVKVRVRRKVGATANLDRFSARRLCNIAGRGEETVLQVEQRNQSRKQEKCAALNRLTKTPPYKDIITYFMGAKEPPDPGKLRAKIQGRRAAKIRGRLHRYLMGSAPG